MLSRIKKMICRCCKPENPKLFLPSSLGHTHGIKMDVDPAKFKQHQYGLPDSMWNSIKNRSYWITGGGTGYGRSIAVALASAGAEVFITGRRTKKLEETREEMLGYGVETGRCHTLPADISVESEVLKACRFIESKSSSLTGLVNNAAVFVRPDYKNPLLSLSIEEWKKMIGTDITAQWLVTKSIFPHMIKGAQARIIFIGSEAGWAFTSGSGHYNMCKTALNNLSSSFAEEIRSAYPDKDVQVNELIPGESRTELNQGSTLSPYMVVPMTLALLAQPAGGPSGYHFHRDGRHFPFAYKEAYQKELL